MGSLAEPPGPSAGSVDVVVVGGSLVGLSASLFLAAQGVSCLVVERRATTSTYRRAWGLNPRTMELFRRIGVEPAIRQAEAAFSPEMSHLGELIKAESLAGRVLMSYKVPDFSDVTAAQWGICAQNLLEPILAGRAREAGVDLRFGSELVADAGRELEGERPSVRIREIASGREEVWRARYVVAADGPRSSIREKLGIGLRGPAELSHHMTIGFRADLSRALGNRNILICHVEIGDTFATLIPEDKTGLWQFDIRYDPTRTGADAVDDRGWKDLIRTAVGDRDIEPIIEYRVPWQTEARVAERFRRGPVFLAGDSAHMMPPTGGLGANTGIQDAHNLAWKLAAVIRGEAAPALLETYDAERRPTAAFAVGQAVARYGARLGYEEAELPPMVDEVTLWFGQRYRSPAVLTEATSLDRPWHNPRRPTGEPGCRAPHVELERRRARVPVHDLFGPGFVLLTAAAEASWRAAAELAAARLGVEISVHGVGSGLADGGGAWQRRYGVEPEGAVLVRPDGFVGWRTRSRPRAPVLVLEEALSRLLGRC